MFPGFQDIFFWGKQDQDFIDVKYTPDDVVIPELEGKLGETKFNTDRILLRLQRVLIRELILLKILKLEITIFGAQSWSFKGTFHDKISISDEPIHNIAPIWIWWPEYKAPLDLPSPEDFHDDESINAFNEIWSPGDFLWVQSAEFIISPSIPEIYEWKDDMKWQLLDNKIKSEIVDLLLAILADNEMKPMEFLLMCILFHPDTPILDKLIIKKWVVDLVEPGNFSNNLKDSVALAWEFGL